MEYQVDTWYRIDVLLDWNSTQIALFVDGVYVLTTPFSSLPRDNMMKCHSTEVDTLMIYNLSPDSATAFRNIKLCSDFCDDFELSLPEGHRINRMVDAQGRPIFVTSNPFSIFNRAVSLTSLSTLATAASLLCLIGIFAF